MLHKTIPPMSYYENFKNTIRNKDVESAKLFIQEAIIKGYDLNSHDKKTKYTLLHFVISKATENDENKLLEILQLLKKAGCDLNQPALDSFHNTPIHTASRRALPRILLWLLQNGAQPNVVDTKGQRPIDYVDKQLHCDKSHMNEIHKEKLQNIKNILSDYGANRNEIKQECVQNQSICRLGLFAVASVATAAIFALKLNL